MVRNAENNIPSSSSLPNSVNNLICDPFLEDMLLRYAPTHCRANALLQALVCSGSTCLYQLRKAGKRNEFLYSIQMHAKFSFGRPCHPTQHQNLPSCAHSDNQCASCSPLFLAQAKKIAQHKIRHNIRKHYQMPENPRTKPKLPQTSRS